MNFTFLVGLLKGSNTYDTVVKILGIVAGFLAGRDANNTGTDKTAPLETRWLNGSETIVGTPYGYDKPSANAGGSDRTTTPSPKR